MTGRKKKGLSGDDAALWKAVSATVTPLDDRPEAPSLAPLPKEYHQPLSERPLPTGWLAGESKPATVGTDLDRKERRRLSRGHIQVDQTLDLHGMTQDQAYGRLKRRLEMAVKHGNRVVLVITGKGGKRWAQSDGSAAHRTRGDFDQLGGVLRSKVPMWLESPELAKFVRSYGSAAPGHGGDGALYVMLRRLGSSPHQFGR